jgi:hypothetical protein
MTTAEVERLLKQCRSHLRHPGFVITRNNTRWVNGRDQMIPKKCNAPPTNWWYRKNIPSCDVLSALMRHKKLVEVTD